MVRDTSAKHPTFPIRERTSQFTGTFDAIYT
jgi:hypothetical protein